MASNMIHYVISKKILERIEVEDSERFLFGASIVPDVSIHEDGSYDKAHFQGWSIDYLKKGIDWNLFEQQYYNSFDIDSIYLGYWCHLVQDAIWFHDIVDKYIRIYPQDIRKNYYQKGYSDYKRLNYLLFKEYHLVVPSFSQQDIPVKEVRKDLVQTKLDTFYEQFNFAECTKNDLIVYTWDVVIKYIEKCVEFCVYEIEARKNNGVRSNPSRFFVVS